MKRNTYTIEKAKTIFRNQNMVLLEQDYKNCQTPMLCKCLTCGTSSKRQLLNILQEHECRFCMQLIGATKTAEKNRRFNDAVFDVIGIEESYWLGVLWADGNVSRKGSSISLTSVDLDFILSFKRFLHSDNKISVIFPKNEAHAVAYKLVVTSKKMWNNLFVIGLTPKKSLTVGIPKIAPELYWSFILGLFDGDGSIFVSKRGSWAFDLVTASKDLYEWLFSFFIKEGFYPKGGCDVRTHNTRYDIKFFGSVAKDVLEKCYISIQGKFSPLERKYVKFLILKNQKIRTKYNLWEVDLLKKANLSNMEVFELINKDKRNTYKRSLKSIVVKRSKLRYCDRKVIDAVQETINKFR